MDNQEVYELCGIAISSTESPAAAMHAGTDRRICSSGVGHRSLPQGLEHTGLSPGFSDIDPDGGNAEAQNAELLHRGK